MWRDEGIGWVSGEVQNVDPVRLINRALTLDYLISGGTYTVHKEYKSYENRQTP